jgi:hypothetical protein
VPVTYHSADIKNKTNNIMRGTLVYTPFVAGLVASVILTLYLAPSGAGTDIFIFKDAGCNLALGQGFNTFSIPGSPGLTPHIFSSYAPGFPFVFGLFSIIFGCTAESNTLFNYVVGAVASGLFWGIAHTTIHSRLHKVIAGFLVGLFGPFALVSYDADRPETLAFSFFVVTCLATWRCNSGTYISALLAGITALIHPFAGLLAFVVVWASAQARAFDSNASPDRLFSNQSLKISLQVALLALIPLLMTSFSYAILDSAASERFSQHAAGPLSVVTSLDDKRYIGALIHAFSSSGANSIILVASYLSSVIFCTICLRWRNPRTLSIPIFALQSTVITLTFAPALFPYQNNYMKFVAVALPVVVILSPLLFRVHAVRPKCASVLVMLVVLFAVIGSSMGIVHRWGARQNYAKASQAVAEFSSAFGQDSAEVVLLDNPGVYFMYKTHFPRLANVWYLQRELYQSPEIKTFITCRMGLRPEAQTVDLSTINRHGVQLMKPSGPFRAAVFGIPLTSSDWGWECSGFRLL